MKTYKKTIEAPVLEIYYDNFAENPLIQFEDWIANGAKWHFLGRNVPKDLQNTEISTLLSENYLEFMDGSIIYSFLEKHYTDFTVYPVRKLEHGSIMYRIGDKYNADGFILIPKDVDFYNNDIVRLLEDFTCWVNGECYGYVEHNEQGEEIRHECGFYGLDEVYNALGNEWENEDLFEYITN